MQLKTAWYHESHDSIHKAGMSAYDVVSDCFQSYYEKTNTRSYGGSMNDSNDFYYWNDVTNYVNYDDCYDDVNYYDLLVAYEPSPISQALEQYDL